MLRFSRTKIVTTLAVILIGDGLHYLHLRRERARASRPL